MRSRGRGLARSFGSFGLAVLFVAVATFGFDGLFGTGVSANHPVLVEGEQDYDGDGLLGMAEDLDNSTDRVFGTITAALAAANGAANQNGSVIVVTSGRFPEQVNITAANGNVVLSAAPGVEASIDAVLAGNPDSGLRQTLPGIVVDSPSNRYVTIRNVTVRNWATGIRINNNSRVLIESVRVENNRDFGIHVTGLARVMISRTFVAGSGFRSGAPPVDNTPNPGVGIRFDNTSTGRIFGSGVSGSFSSGIDNNSILPVATQGVALFDNNPNQSRVTVIPDK